MMVAKCENIYEIEQKNLTSNEKITHDLTLS